MAARVFQAVVLAMCLVATVVAQEPEERTDTATIKGTITVDGAPLAEGRVFFHWKGGQFVGCYVKKRGEYHIDALHAGEYLVRIEGKDVPRAYSSRETSSLAVSMNAGKGVLNFDL